jgi:hypothetical protein
VDYHPCLDFRAVALPNRHHFDVHFKTLNHQAVIHYGKTRLPLLHDGPWEPAKCIHLQAPARCVGGGGAPLIANKLVVLGGLKHFKLTRMNSESYP